MRAARGAHRHAGEGAAQFLRGARRAGDQRAQLPRTAAGTRPVRRQCPAPPAAGRPVRAADLQRPGAGRAPGLGPAPGAGDGGQVAAARHLDQDGTLSEATAGSTQREAGQPRGHRRGVPGQFGLVGCGPDPGRRLPERLRAAGQRPGPAARDQLGELGGAGEAPDQRGRTGPVGAQGQHLAGVRVRRARLGVQVVAVVPEHHQAEPGDRGEHRGPGARDHADLAPAHRQPAPVPLGRAEVRGEADVVQGGLGQGGVHAVQVAGVRHDDDHAAARGGRGGGGHGDLGGPFRTGQRRPGGPDRAALGQAGQERRPGGIAAPGAGVRRGRAAGRAGALAVPACGASRSAVACRGGMASRSTSASVPAYRSATARARSKISGVSTGSGDVTRSSRASLPWCSLVSVRSSR